MKPLALAFALALTCQTLGAQEKKKEAEVGPYNLPTLAAVKEKCKTSEEQNGKLEEVYRKALENEAETRKRSREPGSDRKAIEKSLEISKNQTIYNIKEVLDRDQGKTFDSIIPKAEPKKKK